MTEYGSGSRSRRVTFDRAGLAAAGFRGFQTVRHMRASRCAGAPLRPGVHVILRVAETTVRLRSRSPGGWFKQADPTVDRAILRARWIAETPVLYIGKADVLRDRLDAYMRFGAGAPISHKGGRYIWQVQGSDKLLVAWRQDSQPGRRASRLLADFERQYGSLPFANLRR